MFVDRQKPAERDDVIHQLIDIQYDRNDYELSRGTFRVRGDALDVFPPYADNPLRIEFWGDEIESIQEIDNLTGEALMSFEAIPIWPASHYVTARPKMRKAIGTIQEELRGRLEQLRAEGKLLEAQRLEMRTNYDLEMLETMGFCSGIENYSRHLDGRSPGEPPYTLIDYFPDDFLCIIDESHVTVPQIRGMHEGDRSRKVTLAEHGFRLPSCLDNRPLRFDEFEERVPQFIYVSATPGDYENRVSERRVEQIIRPTGLLDPEIEVRPIASQIDDIIDEARARSDAHERVLITTLTKKMAEDLTDHLLDQGIRSRYMHSDIGTLERVEILRDLRKGEFDVLVGINLLREGLDLPEVTLVAILDADKEGFLRNHRSLIQTIGRAARNVSGKVIMYADKITDSMDLAITETRRRRAIQMAYNEEHGIEPKTIRKAINDVMGFITDGDNNEVGTAEDVNKVLAELSRGEVMRIIAGMEEGIFPHANYEAEAAQLEEERRLAYVAITRARKRLYLTYASTRRTYGSVQANPVSRFVGEIPQEHVKAIGVGSAGFSGVGWAKRGDRHGTFGSGRGSEVYGGNVFGSRTRSTGGAPAPRTAPIQKDPARASASFAVGDQVSHKTFGPGIVLAVQGDTIEVKFTRTNKTKKLMKGFAPIVKIEG